MNKYTAAGRAEIHKNLECVDMSIRHSLMKNPITSATVEYNDNRISLYVAQQGKCAITKKQLSLEEIHVQPLHESVHADPEGGHVPPGGAGH